MCSQMYAGHQWQTAPANNHRVAGEAHSEACLRPKAAGNKALRRYVRSQLASTDGGHVSDLSPFSPVARDSLEVRARRRNRQWNHRRPGQTESAIAGLDTHRKVYGCVPGVRADAAWNIKRRLGGRGDAYTSNTRHASLPSDGGIRHEPADSQPERRPSNEGEDSEEVLASSCGNRGITTVGLT
jgi:hypothetical protein